MVVSNGSMRATISGEKTNLEEDLEEAHRRCTHISEVSCEVRGNWDQLLDEANRTGVGCFDLGIFKALSMQDRDVPIAWLF